MPSFVYGSFPSRLGARSAMTPLFSRFELCSARVDYTGAERKTEHINRQTTTFLEVDTFSSRRLRTPSAVAATCSAPTDLRAPSG